MSQPQPAATTTLATPDRTPDRDPNRTDPIDRLTGRRLARAAGEFAAAAVGTGVVSLAAQWVLGRIPVPAQGFLPVVVSTVGSLALLAGVLAVVGRRGWPRWATAASWLLVSLLNTVILAALLMGTRYFLGGITVDQQFRTEYLTRLTDSARLADFAYANTPPYYPAGWFWLGGRFANLIGQPAWAAYKPWAILSVSVISVLVFVLWSLVVTRRTALLLAVATSLVGLFGSASEPYSWLAVATLPPLLVLAWRMLTALRTGQAGPVWPTVVLLGVGVGVDGTCYTLLCGFLAFALALLAVVTIVVGVRSRAMPVGRLLLRLLGRAAGLAAVAIPLLLLVWTPYLLAVLRGDHGVNLAPRYLPEASTELPTPMFGGTILAGLGLLGLVWLVLRVTRSALAQALTIGAAAIYVWFALSTVGIAFGTTLLAFRLAAVLQTVLACAAVLGLTELVTLARDGAFRLPGRTVRALAAVLGLLAAVGLAQQVPDVNQDLVTAARTEYYPTGVTATGERDPDNLSAQLPQLTSAIAALTGRRADQLTLLTDDWSLLSVQPYWSFQASTPHYANPLGGFDQRRAEVAAWAAAGTPGQLTTELRASAFAAPEVFVLRDGPDGRLHVSLSRDVFPQEPNVDYYDISFDPAVFDSPDFTVRPVGGFTVIVWRPGLVHVGP